MTEQSRFEQNIGGGGPNEPSVGSSVNNAGSDPGNGLRRSGGSANDPHGGHEHIGAELGSLDPDPVSQLVPGGQGAEAPPYAGEYRASGLLTPDPRREGDSPADMPIETLAYTAVQEPNLPTNDLVPPVTSDQVQGAGKLEEPVERRANNLVFDPQVGNFQIKDQVHATGVTSQDKT